MLAATIRQRNSAFADRRWSCPWPGSGAKKYFICVNVKGGIPKIICQIFGRVIPKCNGQVPKDVSRDLMRIIFPVSILIPGSLND
jgi:hypothetical protein